MANWALPSLTSNYTDFLTHITDRQLDTARWFSTAYTAATLSASEAGAVRWNDTNKNWDSWSGSAWGVLSATYNINSTGYSTSLVGGNNTTLLGSIPYQSNTNTTTLLSPNTTTTKKFLIQTGTGTNGAAPVWDTVVVADVSGAAPLASPVFTGTPSLPTGTAGVTQTVGDNTTKLATTAFVLANGTSLEASTVPVMDGTASVGSATKGSKSDHRHPIDTSRAAVGQTFYLGTTNVAINRASSALNLTGINIDGSSGSCTGNAVTANYATTAGSADNTIGIGQTWTLPSRALNTTYTNTTSKPIEILITITIPQYGAAGAAYLVLDGTTVALNTGDAGGTTNSQVAPMSAIIPINSTYRVTTTGSPTLQYWAELR